MSKVNIMVVADATETVFNAESTDGGFYKVVGCDPEVLGDWPTAGMTLDVAIALARRVASRLHASKAKTTVELTGDERRLICRLAASAKDRTICNEEFAKLREIIEKFKY